MNTISRVWGIDWVMGVPWNDIESEVMACKNEGSHLRFFSNVTNTIGYLELWLGHGHWLALLWHIYKQEPKGKRAYKFNSLLNY